MKGLMVDCEQCGNETEVGSCEILNNYGYCGTCNSACTDPITDDWRELVVALLVRIQRIEAGIMTVKQTINQEG